MIIPSQVVSESLAQSSPLLSSLLLMDNDIATVAEGALDVVKDLKQLDLTGKVQNVTLADAVSHKNYFDNSLALFRDYMVFMVIFQKTNLDQFCHMRIEQNCIVTELIVKVRFKCGSHLFWLGPVAMRQKLSPSHLRVDNGPIALKQRNIARIARIARNAVPYRFAFNNQSQFIKIDSVWACVRS